jgi:hypothetical protein
MRKSGMRNEVTNIFEIEKAETDEDVGDKRATASREGQEVKGYCSIREK